jgi:hypothetical protein
LLASYRDELASIDPDACFTPFVGGEAQHIECRALAAKRCLGLSDSQALDPYAAAERVGIHVFGEQFFERFSPEERRQVLRTGATQWSAGTIVANEGRQVGILLNPTHHATRRRATLAEELAHVVIGHPPSVIDANTGMRTYDAELETEAYGVGAAMLMPYAQLFALCRRGILLAQIADRYQLSSMFTNYRINRCGLRKMYSRRSKTSA